MALKPSKFKLDESVSLVGNMMRVTGILQLEDPAGQVATRYLLNGSTGAEQILEELSGNYALLRAFPPAAQPQAAGDSVTVMGEKYSLAGVSKLKITGTGGKPPGGLADGSALLSGKFEGPLGTLLREIVPGNAAQNFYAIKPVPTTEILTAEQVAAIQAAEMQMREEQVQAGAETESGSSSGTKKIIRFVVVILVVAGLAYACSSSDDPGSASSSARTVSSGFHGK